MRAIIFFMDEEFDEYTDFKAKHGLYGLSDLRKYFKNCIIEGESLSSLRQIDGLNMLFNNNNLNLDSLIISEKLNLSLPWEVKQ